ncbi:nucleobase:cation symporter-2 family protein [Nocardiopsis suaedae]|uniref:Nucleobase:cation symporter-2 family protein n=1 Tax=Nocardiopsis suaedae TaxID=3018444 RepID=A0ABT4TFS2_9ACTN|nr:nucleobase:cation symporter-2 family protein [Nocardiopsis suaedae]MDA2802977.1 nucleobase:cation symporter-2 family protein [Nocardiopsis suaedae]
MPNDPSGGDAPGVPSPRPEDRRLSAGQYFVGGLQHLLTMYAGLITPPLIIGTAAGLDSAETAVMIAATTLLAGLATLLQTLGPPRLRLGSQLPIVVGATFVPVGAMESIAADGGLPAVFGASLAAGLFALAITPFFGSLVRFFPPIVTGTIVTVIGLSLFPVAIGWIVDGGAGGTPATADLGLGLGTLALVLALNRVPGVLGRFAILIGLSAGTAVAAAFGRTDFSGVLDGPVFALPEPFHYGMPAFDPAAIVTMCIVMLVVLTEGTANIMGVGAVVGARIDRRRISDGIRASALSSALAPVLNTFPVSSFAQNIGLVAMTRVRSRFVVAWAGGLLVALGLFPVLGRFVAAIPMPVLGGAGLVLFGTVAASGVKTIAEADLTDQLNLVLVGASLAAGLTPMLFPHFYEGLPGWAATVLHSGIVGASAVAIGLNVLFTLGRGGRGPESSAAGGEVPGGGAAEAPAGASAAAPASAPSARPEGG